MSVFCLVHGSTQNASGWARLVPELERRGHQTVCVNLPANEPDANASRYAQVIAEALPDSNAIIVAHSVSGTFLPLVPSFHAVSRLVFLAAFVPEVGKSPMEQLQAHPEMFYPDWIGKDPTKDHHIALRYLFHDCDAETARWALGTLRLMYARRALIETCPLEKWPDVPCSCVLCCNDRTLRADYWREQVRRQLQVEPMELAGGHCPHVSRPAELAETLSGLCRSDAPV